MGFLVYALCFCLVVVIGYASYAGAPWVPVRRFDMEALIKDLDLRSGQQFVELGCGDGRLLRAVGTKDIQAIGYEINPLLWGIAWFRNIPHKNVRVKFGNMWRADVSRADVVMVFLVPRTMPRLSQKAEQEMKPGSRLVSYIFPAQLPNGRKAKSWYVYGIEKSLKKVAKGGRQDSSAAYNEPHTDGSNEQANK